jgi:hypothetical protein
VECIAHGLSQLNCTLCSDGYYVDASNICQSCIGTISNCYLCSNGSYCLECASNTMAVNSYTGQCQLCTLSFPNCQTCTNTQCLTCPQGLSLAANALSCSCYNGGSYVTGYCTNVDGCTSVVPNTDGSQECAACDSSQFHEVPVDG